MRVVVVGASGNVGTSVLRSLGAEAAVDSILGLCRRLPEAEFDKTQWRAADVRALTCGRCSRGLTPWYTSRG